MAQSDTDFKKQGLGMMLAAWFVLIGLLGYYFYHQERQAQNPNRNLDAQSKHVELTANRQGHFLATGFINSQKVDFLVDTGATNVTIPANMKQQLALPSGYQGLANTANGTVQVESTVINQLQIGGIELYNVPASLNPGMNYSKEILLGMQALKQLDIQLKGGKLILIQ